VLGDLGLIVDRTVLAAAVRVMDQPGGWAAHGEGFAQSGKSQIAVHPVAGGPADDPAREQVDDDGEVQPTLAGPDIGNVGAPFLVRPGCREVRPLVCTRRTASSSNSFVNRRCCITELLFTHTGTLHFSEASPEWYGEGMVRVYGGAINAHSTAPATYNPLHLRQKRRPPCCLALERSNPPSPASTASSPSHPH
jgi:hypothetical protein